MQQRVLGLAPTGKVSSKYRSKSWGHNNCHDVASEGALVDVDHYHHTEVGNSFAHKVDAEMPI